MPSERANGEDETAGAEAGRQRGDPWLPAPGAPLTVARNLQQMQLVLGLQQRSALGQRRASSSPPGPDVRRLGACWLERGRRNAGVPHARRKEEGEEKNVSWKGPTTIIQSTRLTSSGVPHPHTQVCPIYTAVPYICRCAPSTQPCLSVQPDRGLLFV